MSGHLRARRRPGEPSDAELIEDTRRGDREAYGELWRRHASAGRAVARAYTTRFDPDDLIAEAFARILKIVDAGGGPTGAFRAYLFTTIRHTAAGWGRTTAETTIEDADTIEDPRFGEENSLAALDRSLTASAFRTLPTRWQEVLWYSEVEQLTPQETGPILGMKANSVAALAYRAREGLRQAWIQAHISSVPSESECRWTIDRLGAHARHALTARNRRRVEEHLADCAKCSIVASEVDEVGSRLALILLPLFAGIAGATGYVAWLQQHASDGTFATGGAAVAPAALIWKGSAAGHAGSAAGTAGTATGTALTGGGAGTVTGAGLSTLLTSAIIGGGILAASALVAVSVFTAANDTSPLAGPSLSAGAPATSRPATPQPPPSQAATAASAPVTVSASNDPIEASPTAPVARTTRPAGTSATSAAPSSAVPPASTPPATTPPVTTPPFTTPPVTTPPVTVPPVTVPPVTVPPVTVPPVTPVPTITGVDTGASGGAGAYFPVVSGTAEPGATVTIFDNGTALAQATADSTGAWTSGQLSNATRTGSLTATQTSTTGVTSAASVAVPYATTTPDLTVVSAGGTITVALGSAVNAPIALTVTAGDITYTATDLRAQSWTLPSILLDLPGVTYTLRARFQDDAGRFGPTVQTTYSPPESEAIGPALLSEGS